MGKSKTVGKKYFPRYSYTTDRVESFFRRGHSVQQNKNVFIKHTFGDVRLKFICKGRGRLCKDFTEHAKFELQASDEGTQCDEGATFKPSVTVVHTHCYRRECQWHTDLVLLTICNANKVAEIQAKHLSSLFGITPVKEIKRNVDLLLERYACRSLKEMVDKVIPEREETNFRIETVQTSVPNNARHFGKGTNNTFNNGLLKDDQSNTPSRQVIKDVRGEKRKVDDGSSRLLRSGKRFRQATEEATHKLDNFLLDVMAFFIRSDVPTSEWPKIKYPKRRSLKRKVVENLFTTDPTLNACGFQHHILEIFLDRMADYSRDDYIVRILQDHKIVHYHFNYGPFIYTELCSLEVGSKLRGSLRDICHLRATLGGFAIYDKDIYALVARHFAEAVYNMIEYKGVNGMYTALKVEKAESKGELDITALKLKQRSVTKDTRFKDSRGTFVQSKLIDFQRLQENDVQCLLQGERIFAWTGSSAVRPSIGKITIPVLKRPNCQHNYVVIENENDEYANQGAVGPPVAELFGKRGDSGAIVCFDDRDGNGIHVVSMLVGEMKFDLVGFLTLPLQQGLQQVEASLGGNLQLC